MQLRDDEPRFRWDTATIRAVAASMTDGSFSIAGSAVSRSAENAVTISSFAKSYRLRRTHSVSSKTNRLTKTCSPLANSRSISRRAFSYRDLSSRVRYRMRTLVSTPSISATVSRRAEVSCPFCATDPQVQPYARFFTRMMTTPFGIDVKPGLHTQTVANQLGDCRLTLAGQRGGA